MVDGNHTGSPTTGDRFATGQIMKMTRLWVVCTAKGLIVMSPSIPHPCFLGADVLFDKEGGLVEGK